MKLLSYSEISQVSGGEFSEDALKLMEHYSFSFASLGVAASGIYGILTNTPTTITVGATTTLVGSYSSVILAGLGLSWGAGVVFGLCVAAYNQDFARNH